MLVKIIIVLILTIAVGVLGFSDIGEGVFNFVDKSAAAEFAEDARDLTQVIEIYNTDQQGAQTAFVGAGITSAPADLTEAATDRETLGDFLSSAAGGDFLKKPISTDYQVVVTATSAYLRLEVTSPDVCSEINEIAGLASDPAATDLEADLTTELAAFAGITIDDLEMACISDDDKVAVNVAYYRLGAAN